MMELFRGHVDWRILSFYLENPSGSFYVKELSRKLRVSPSSVSKTVKLLRHDKVLVMERKGLAHLYRLNEELPSVRMLKSAYVLIKLKDCKLVDRFLEVDNSLISLALYGSYAAGAYDERSDLDLLVITQKKKNVFHEPIRKLEEKLGVEISLDAFTLAQWKNLAKSNDPFYRSVVDEHVLLYGGALE